MRTGDAKPIDRALLVQRRNRIAADAGAYDFLLVRVAEDLTDRLEIVQRKFPTALNLGAYNGALSRHIRKLDHVGIVFDADASSAFLSACDGPSVLCDEEVLPFAQDSLDLVVSGLSLQFVNDLPGTFVQICRALKPDGLLLAAMFGGETLKELRYAWLVAESDLFGGASPRVAPFTDVRALGALSQRAGFALPVVDSETITVTYASPLALMLELRAMGASNVLNGRRSVPVSRRLVQRACEIYSEQFGSDDGRVPATFEILTLTAWSPDESQPRPLKPGSAEISLTRVLPQK